MGWHPGIDSLSSEDSDNDYRYILFDLEGIWSKIPASCQASIYIPWKKWKYLYLVCEKVIYVKAHFKIRNVK